MEVALSERWREAPLADPLPEVLRFLYTMTREPTALTPADAEAVIGAGVSLRQLEVAALTCVIFNVMNRLVDAFGADITDQQAAMIKPMLWTLGGIGRVIGRRRASKLCFGASPPVEITRQVAAIHGPEGDAPQAVRAAAYTRALERVGATPRVAATSASSGEALSEPARDYVDTIAVDAHGVTDAHVDDLRAAGFSDRAIFELTFCIACGAAFGQLELAWPCIVAGARGSGHR